MTESLTILTAAFESRRIGARPVTASDWQDAEGRGEKWSRGS